MNIEASHRRIARISSKEDAIAVDPFFHRRACAFRVQGLAQPSELVLYQCIHWIENQTAHGCWSCLSLAMGSERISGGVFLQGPTRLRYCGEAVEWPPIRVVPPAPLEII